MANGNGRNGNGNGNGHNVVNGNGRYIIPKFEGPMKIPIPERIPCFTPEDKELGKLLENANDIVVFVDGSYMQAIGNGGIGIIIVSDSLVAAVGKKYQPSDMRINSSRMEIMAALVAVRLLFDREFELITDNPLVACQIFGYFLRQPFSDTNNKDLWNEMDFLLKNHPGVKIYHKDNTPEVFSRAHGLARSFASSSS